MNQCWARAAGRGGRREACGVGKACVCVRILGIRYSSDTILASYSSVQAHSSDRLPLKGAAARAWTVSDAGRSLQRLCESVYL